MSHPYSRNPDHIRNRQVPAPSNAAINSHLESLLEHPPTRERWMELDEITAGKNATVVGKKTGRNPQNVMKWVYAKKQLAY